VNADEGKAGMVLFADKTDPCLSALSVPPLPKRRYINTLPFLSFSFIHCSSHKMIFAVLDDLVLAPSLKQVRFFALA